MKHRNTTASSGLSQNEVNFDAINDDRGAGSGGQSIGGTGNNGDLTDLR